MASDSDPLIKALAQHHPATTLRLPSRRKISFRRRRLPTVRLGGKKPRGAGFFLVGVFRRVKMRWLKLKQKQLRMLKKLKEYYRSLMKDIVEGGGTIEAFQQRLILETSFAVPVMGLSFNSFPSNY